MESLKNKVALVTGAGKGIGKSIAIALAKEGVHVGLIARTEKDLQDLATELINLGVKSIIAPADISNINAVNWAVEKIENALYWHFTKTKNYWEQANSLQSGAAQPHFNGAAVKQVVFAYPKSVREQQALIEKFETLSIETKKLEAIYQQKIRDLEDLKKSVLQKAFSGELKTEKAFV